MTEETRCPQCDEATVCGHGFHRLVSSSELEALQSRLDAAEVKMQNYAMTAKGNEIYIADLLKRLDAAKERLISAGNAVDIAQDTATSDALRAAAAICKRASNPQEIFDTAPSIECPAKVAKLFEITTELILALTPDHIRLTADLRDVEVQKQVLEKAAKSFDNLHWHLWDNKEAAAYVMILVDECTAQASALAKQIEGLK